MAAVAHDLLPSRKDGLLQTDSERAQWSPAAEDLIREGTSLRQRGMVLPHQAEEE